jgi:hypothetical protein
MWALCFPQTVIVGVYQVGGNLDFMVLGNVEDKRRFSNVSLMKSRLMDKSTKPS